MFYTGGNASGGPVKRREAEFELFAACRCPPVSLRSFTRTHRFYFITAL